MPEDIRTLKMYFPGMTINAGAKFNDEDGSGEQSIPNTGNFTLNTPSRNNTENFNSWEWDSLVMTTPTSNAFPGGVSFRCWNEQRIDLTGFLQMGAALAPLGSASQRAAVPQLPGRWEARSAATSLTYLKDFTIWSTEPLTTADKNNLYSSAALKNSITPNMPAYASSGGSMSTTQMLSSQTRYYTADSAVSSRIGFLRELFAQMGGMGETAASPHVYVTRVVIGQFSTASTDEVNAALGTSGTINDWTADKFFIAIPSSWELLNVGIIEPDELEYLTYMQRSVLAPEGR